MLRDVDAEIENIKRSIDEIYKHKDRYGIGEGEFQSEGHIEEEAAESLRKRRRDVEEEEVVGLVHDSNIVIKQLLKTDSCLNVVSIIGMGGLGKTTFARKIYNKKEVRELLPCRAWGYVSNEYRAKELLLNLLQCLMSSTPTLDIISAETNIVSCGMWKLKQLRHVSGRIRLSAGMSRVNSEILWNLQNLLWMDLDPRTAYAYVLNNGSFPNLRELALVYNNDKKKYSAREQLQSLHCLSNLGKLKIYGTAELPLDRNEFPSNLTKITLRQFGKFDTNCMSTLAQLTNLQVLKLSSELFHDCFYFNCATGEFPQLQVLKVIGMRMKSWTLEKGAMPCLPSLVINCCRFLDELPEQLWSSTTLRQVHVINSIRLTTTSKMLRLTMALSS